MRRLLFLIAPLLLASRPADAQINRSRFQLKAPSNWVSAGVEYQQPFTVLDGKNSAAWQFGSATMFDASIEHTLDNGLFIGIRGSTGLVPLVYNSPFLVTDADANVSQLFGTLRLASGMGFHTVLELSAGATLYSNFRARTNGAKLGPDSIDPDFAFAFGYGFGYSFSRSFSVDVVQDVTTSIHQNTGLSPSDNASTRINGTRVMGRIGLGG